MVMVVVMVMVMVMAMVVPIVIVIRVKTTLPLACCWAVVSSGEGSESVHGPTENLK